MTPNHHKKVYPQKNGNGQEWRTERRTLSNEFNSITDRRQRTGESRKSQRQQQSPVVRDQHFVAWTADQDEQAEDAMKEGRRRGRSRIKRSDINFLVICCDYDCHRRSQKLVTHPLSQAQEPGLSVRLSEAGVPDVYPDRQGARLCRRILCE